MPTSYTSLLGYALPATGELDGTWGTTVNNSITQLIEDSVAGVATASVTAGNWTLSTTGSGAANEARCAIIIPTGTPGVSRNIIAPSQSKAYVVDNQSNAAIVFKGAATTGVTLSAGGKALIAWNGSDFVNIGVAGLPDQTSNSGKFLTTNGTNASWAVVGVTNGALTGNLVGGDYTISQALLKDTCLVFLDKGNSGTSTQTLDYTAGSHQKITATGNFTIATSNWPPTGNLGVIILEAANFGAYTVTWPTINWVKPDGTTTTSVSTWLAAITGRTAFQSSGTDFIKLWTRDAGTTIYGGFFA